MYSASKNSSNRKIKAEPETIIANSLLLVLQGISKRYIISETNIEEVNIANEITDKINTLADRLNRRVLAPLKEFKFYSETSFRVQDYDTRSFFVNENQKYEALRGIITNIIIEKYTGQLFSDIAKLEFIDKPDFYPTSEYFKLKPELAPKNLDYCVIFTSENPYDSKNNTTTLATLLLEKNPDEKLIIDIIFRTLLFLAFLQKKFPGFIHGALFPENISLVPQHPFTAETYRPCEIEVGNKEKIFALPSKNEIAFCQTTNMTVGEQRDYQFERITQTYRRKNYCEYYDFLMQIYLLITEKASSETKLRLSSKFCDLQAFIFFATENIMLDHNGYLIDNNHIEEGGYVVPTYSTKWKKTEELLMHPIFDVLLTKYIDDNSSWRMGKLKTIKLIF